MNFKYHLKYRLIVRSYNIMESKGFFYYLRKNEQKSSKQRIKIIEHEIDDMEKGNLNNLDYKRIITLEAELDEIHD